MNEAIREVYKQSRDAQDKYTYFMLTVAGAGIALSVNQTAGSALKWSQCPLGAAVLCWGLSFFCGARHLAYVASTLFANHTMLTVEAGLDPRAQEPWMMQAASEGIRAAIQGNSDKAVIYARWQFRLLVTGAVLFVVWHVLEMWLRIPRH